MFAALFGRSKKEKSDNPVLAAGWEEFWDPRYGVAYFVNKKQKKSQWEHPGYSTPDGKPVKLESGSKEAGRDAVKIAVTTPKKSNATSLEASNSETYKCIFGKGKLGLVLEEGTYSTGQTYVKVVSVGGQAEANGVQINSAIIRVGAQDFLQNPTVNEVTEALTSSTKPMEVMFKRSIQETGSSKEDVAKSKSPAKVDSTKSPKMLVRWTKWTHRKQRR